MPDTASPPASITVVLSGPKTSASQARNALAARGLELVPGDHAHGLSAAPSGDEPTQPVAFITARADHPDTAVEAVAGLGWVLRMHHTTPVPLPASDLEGVMSRLSIAEQKITQLHESVRTVTRDR